MLTYASTSPVLSMKTIYPNLFRTCPSDSAQANAFSDLIEKYSWEKVGIIAADDMYGRELAADIENLLKIKAIKITTVQTFKSGADSMMKQVDNVSSLINIISLSSGFAVRSPIRNKPNEEPDFLEKFLIPCKQDEKVEVGRTYIFPYISRPFVPNCGQKKKKINLSKAISKQYLVSCQLFI